MSEKLLNLGPKSTAWLNEIGIYDLAALKEVGVVEAFQLIRCHHANASLNLLWSLEGALTGVPWDQIDSATKARLKRDIGY